MKKESGIQILQGEGKWNERAAAETANERKSNKRRKTMMMMSMRRNRKGLGQMKNDLLSSL
jgi:uncharacterized protein YjiS (DUF1127 family)